MEGILLVLAVMLLFALIATNRFQMLRKMADKVFAAFQEAALNKYETLVRWLSETGDRAGMHSNADDHNRLKKLLEDTRKPGLTVDQQVALENSISKLEKTLFDISPGKANQRETHESARSAYHHAKNKTDELKKQYNDTVVHYNNAVFLFPSNVFALVFGFKQRKIFDTGEGKTDHQQIKGKYYKIL